MCDFEEFSFTCGHSAIRLKSFCHRARNNYGHRCDSVKILRINWPQFRVCDECAARARLEVEQQEQQQERQR
jgi:hypothetical protein